MCILSVTLTNDKTIDASFSARMGDKYVVSESGKAYMNWPIPTGSRSGTGLIQEEGPWSRGPTPPGRPEGRAAGLRSAVR